MNKDGINFSRDTIEANARIRSVKVEFLSGSRFPVEIAAASLAYHRESSRYSLIGLKINPLKLLWSLSVRTYYE